MGKGGLVQRQTMQNKCGNTGTNREERLAFWTTPHHHALNKSPLLRHFTVHLIQNRMLTLSDFHNTIIIGYLSQEKTLEKCPLRLVYATFGRAPCPAPQKVA